MSEMELAQRVRALEVALGRQPEIGFSGHYARAATVGTGQTFLHNTLTIINFDTVTRDPRSLVTTGANWRFTAKVAGDYAVSAFILWATTTDWAIGEVGELRPFKNGVVASTISRDDNNDATAAFKPNHGVPDIIQLAAGDYIDMRAIQTSGNTRALFASAQYNHIAIWRLT